MRSAATERSPAAPAQSGGWAGTVARWPERGELPDPGRPTEGLRENQQQVAAGGGQGADRQDGSGCPAQREQRGGEAEHHDRHRVDRAGERVRQPERRAHDRGPGPGGRARDQGEQDGAGERDGCLGPGPAGPRHRQGEQQGGPSGRLIGSVGADPDRGEDTQRDRQQAEQRGDVPLDGAEIGEPGLRGQLGIPGVVGEEGRQRVGQQPDEQEVGGGEPDRPPDQAAQRPADREPRKRAQQPDPGRTAAPGADQAGSDVPPAGGQQRRRRQERGRRCQHENRRGAVRGVRLNGCQQPERGHPVQPVQRGRHRRRPCGAAGRRPAPRLRARLLSTGRRPAAR